MHHETSRKMSGLPEMLNTHPLRGPQLGRQNLHLFLQILAKNTRDPLLQFAGLWKQGKNNYRFCYASWFYFFFFKLSSECFDGHQKQGIFCNRGIKSNCRRGRKATYKSWNHDKRNLLNVSSEKTLSCTGEKLLPTLALILQRAKCPKLLCEITGDEDARCAWGNTWRCRKTQEQIQVL